MAGRSTTARTARSGWMLLLLAPAMVVASCGGSDDDGGTAAGIVDGPTTIEDGEDAATVTSDGTEADDTGSSEDAEPEASSGGGDATTDATTGAGGGAGEEEGDPEPATTADGVDDPGAGATAPPPGTGGDGPVIGAGPIDPGLQPLIDRAVAQLVEEHGIAPADITVQSARLVQWRNAAAGCPEPRMQYLEVVTDGSVIELVVGTETHWFHSGGRAGLVLCTSPLRERPFASEG